jgi:organic radical activating enzyme
LVKYYQNIVKKRKGEEIMNKLKEYKNGNYEVIIFDDGTKNRYAKRGKILKPKFPESIDLKITNYCDMGCPMCHENSTKNGKHGDLNLPFLNTLKAGTELAIGGGNPLSHPDLENFLIRMKKKGIICNMTVNQNHLMQEYNRLSQYIQKGYITSLGMSLAYSENKNFIKRVKLFKNTVIHVINGLFTEEDYNNLKDQNITLLILGYKQIGRGEAFYSDEVKKNMKWLYDNIEEMFKHFYIISFDNLSLEQLNMHRFLSAKDWSTYFMGEDGMFTMYIDLVEKMYASSSVSTERFRLKRNIKSMFKDIRVRSKGDAGS